MAMMKIPTIYFLVLEVFGSIWLLVRRWLGIHSRTLYNVYDHGLLFGALGGFFNKYVSIFILFGHFMFGSSGR